MRKVSMAIFLGGMFVMLAASFQKGDPWYGKVILLAVLVLIGVSAFADSWLQAFFDQNPRLLFALTSVACLGVAVAIHPFAKHWAVPAALAPFMFIALAIYAVIRVFYLPSLRARR